MALSMSVGVSVGAGVSAAAPAQAAPVTTASTAALPDVVADGYKLTFHDEFDGDTLDTTKWGYQYGCFDPGQRSQAQYTDSPDNVSVQDGYLNLAARYSPMKTKSDGSQIPRTCKSGNTTYSAPFTSGMITTTYAAPASGFYAEARIKLPRSRSSWSSFWATGTNGKLGGWPGNGEIDVFESKGYDPSYLMSNLHSPRANNPKKTEQHQGMMHGDTATSQSEWHTYGVLKTADAIEFYFDGQLTHRVLMSDIKGPNPFVDPENNYTLKLNQMVGGNYLTNANDWSDKTYVDATKFADDYKGGADGTDFADSTMYVDYVRVYEPKTEADQADEPEQPETPTPAPTPAQPEQPADPAPAPENPVTPVQPQPETPAEPVTPAEPTPAPAPETPAQPENPAQPAPAPENPVTPAQPAQPAPSQPAKPTQPAPAVPAKPTPVKPTPAPVQPQPEQNQQAEQPAKPTQPQKPKPQKPRPDRLANTGMTSWYRPIMVAWDNFCGWITSWWFW